MTRALTNEERHYYALNERVWPFVAPFYDAIVLPLRKVRREVADMVALDASSRVLDVATGTGAQASAFLLRKAGVEVLDDHAALHGAVRIVSGVRNGH